MSPKRDFRWLVPIVFVAVSAGLLVAILVIYFTRGFIPGDAVVYLAGGERLNVGHPLYALSPGDRPLGMKPPFWTVPLLSPPLVAVLFRPLALLPQDLGAYVWWFVTMSAIGAVLIAYWRRRPVLTSVAVILLAVPLTYEIGVGNVNAILLIGSVLVWRWTVAGKQELAGGATAFIALLKLSPVVLAWWLVTQRQTRAVVAGIVVGILVLGLTVFGAGLDAHLRFVEITRDTASIGTSELSLAGLARAAGAAPGAAAVLPTVALVTGLVGVLVLRHRPGAAFALAVMTMTLGSPVVNINSYALLLGCLAPLVWPIEVGATAISNVNDPLTGIPTNNSQGAMP